MTHAELVKKASRWLRSQGCAVIITEMASGAYQQPDAIGWHPTYSILVECKASRSDFLSDKNKCHRRVGKSMGDRRYYLAFPGIIKSADLPEKWGLLEPHGKVMKVVVKAGGFYKEEANYGGEIALLISALRRVKGIMPEGVSARFYTYKTKNRATVGIGKED